jgi:glycosyltransferase involved in cell wall biosynthesis
MRFSVVIPTYNNLSELQGCLRALDALQEDDFEVLVGVDGSTDGTLEWLKEAKFHYPLIPLSHPGNENRGRSATRNLALEHLRGEYTLFLDSDMEATAELFSAHLEILKQGDTISIGRIRYRNRKRNLWVRYTAERGVGKYGHGEEVPHNYFITANSALPSRYFIECEGFDPEISHYGGEDMELGYRIQQQFSPKFAHNKAAIVETIQPKTLEQALPQLREYGSTGLPYIAQKWPDLAATYWVNRVHSKKLKHRLFEAMIWPGFRGLARFFIKISPYSIKKMLINYLVISYIHEGYKSVMGIGGQWTVDGGQ